MPSIIEDMKELSRLEQQFEENHNKRMEVLSDAIESANKAQNYEHIDHTKDFEEINSILDSL